MAMERIERHYGSPTEIPEVPDKLDVWLTAELVNSRLLGKHETWTIEGLIDEAIRNAADLSSTHFTMLLHYRDKTEFRIISNYQKWKWQETPDEKYCCLFRAEPQLHKWFTRWWQNRWDINDIRICLDKQKQTAVITEQEDHPSKRLNPHKNKGDV